MLCPSCSAASLDAYGRCQHCGYSAAPPAQPYAAYYPQPQLIAPTAPAGVGLAAQILMAISGLVALVAFGVNFWAYGVARTAYSTSGANTDAINASAGVAGILMFLSLVLCLATGVVFIVWLFKSANLSAILAPGRQALTAGWAIGGWFMPVGCLILPRIVAGGVWRAAIPLAAQPVLRKPRTYLVTWWWLSFCVGQVLIFMPISPARGDLANAWNPVAISFGMSGVADFCRVASALLGILMIRKVTQMQQIRILQGPGAGHPYAGPVVANAPYAAYTEPVPAPFGMPAPLPGPAGPYGPPMGTPYAPAQQPVPAPMPTPEATVDGPYAASLPPQASAPEVERLPATLIEPSEAATEVGLKEPTTEPMDAVPAEFLSEAAQPEAAGPETAEPADAQSDAPQPETAEPEAAEPETAEPADAQSGAPQPEAAEPETAEPEDSVPADKPTAAFPRQQTQDRGTVVLKAIADEPRDEA